MTILNAARGTRPPTTTPGPQDVPALSDRHRLILLALSRVAPDDAALRITDRPPHFNVITRAPDGRVRLFTGRSSKGNRTSIFAPTEVHPGTDAAELMTVQVAHARRLTPPPAPGPWMPVLLAAQCEPLTYGRLIARLHTLIPDVRWQLGWETLWAHLHARGEVTRGSMWRHWDHGMTQVTERSAFNVVYLQRGEAHACGVREFLQNHAPIPAGPPAPRGEPKAWNTEWTNVPGGA